MNQFEWALASQAAKMEVKRVIAEGLGLDDFPPVPHWVVTVELHCRRCGTVGEARLALATWPSFHDALKAREVACGVDGCDGTLDDEKHHILEI